MALLYGVSLSTGNFFRHPQALKNLTSLSRQTKSTDGYNMLHMFNNNTHSDFRTAKKHVLTPSYFIRVI